MTDGPIALAGVPAGSRCVVRQLTGGQAFLSRLAAMGLTPGADVKVIQNFGHGPLIVLARDTRIALGRGEAMRVMVSRLSAAA